MEIQEAIDFLQQNGYDIIPPAMSSDIDDFEKWWNMYDKKRGRDACLKKWRRLSLRDRKKCLEETPRYVASCSSKQFQKDPLTYLNNKAWNDEIISDYDERREIGLFNKTASIINSD